MVDRSSRERREKVDRKRPSQTLFAIDFVNVSLSLSRSSSQSALPFPRDPRSDSTLYSTSLWPLVFRKARLSFPTSSVLSRSLSTSLPRYCVQTQSLASVCYLQATSLLPSFPSCSSPTPIEHVPNIVVLSQPLPLVRKLDPKLAPSTIPTTRTNLA